MSDAWHPWQPVPPLPRARPFTPAVLAELLDGGQAFRWHRQPDGTFEGGWSVHHVRVRLKLLGAPGPALAPAPSAPGSAKPRARLSAADHPTSAPGFVEPALEFSSPVHADLRVTADALHAYLAGPAADEDALPWRSDPHLAACMRACPGLRILRQPFGETLLGFVCSATKQIVQIKQMMTLLASRHGRPVGRPLADAPSVPSPSALGLGGHSASTPWQTLPTWAALATVPEEALRACALGFRARHIAGIAAFLDRNPGWLETTEHAPYPEAKARLLELPGVGEKIADCVLLFGAGRLEAFPVDTWIIKAMARRYGLDNWKPDQIAHFGRRHFGAHAGLAQQYLFAYERSVGR